MVKGFTDVPHFVRRTVEHVAEGVGRRRRKNGCGRSLVKVGNDGGERSQFLRRHAVFEADDDGVGGGKSFGFEREKLLFEFNHFAFFEILSREEFFHGFSDFGGFGGKKFRNPAY